MSSPIPISATKPFAPFEWALAWRYLRARRGFVSVIAGFSFAGIMLGVATLIIVMAVMNGFRAELLAKILGVNGHAVISNPATGLPDFDRLAARLAKVKGVNAVHPYVEGQVMGSTRQAVSGVLVRGMRGGDIGNLPSLVGAVRAGTLKGFDAGTPGVAVGSRLAFKLGLRLNSRLTLISPRGPITPFGRAPRIKSYPVKAIFQIGMAEYDASLVFLPLKEAQAFFNLPETAVSGVEIMVREPDRVAGLQQELIEAANVPSALTTWQQNNATFFNALQVERNVMFLILSLIVLVAAFNVISGLVMLVRDKSHDIAVLRSMGARRGSIMRVFFLTGASIGVIGVVAGVILGVVFCLNIETIRQGISRLLNTELFTPELYYLSELPARMDIVEIAAVAIIALALSLLATLYPSWRAARLDPVEALRNE